MGEPDYVSKVRVERIRRPLRRAETPGEREPVWFGIYDEVAAHYGVAEPGEAERATTLD